MSFDVAIIGAGPAGSTLARLIGARYRVLLVEPRRLDRPAPSPFPDVCCGGLLAPDAQALLSRLGLGLPAAVLVDPQLFSVVARDMPSGLSRSYQRFYMNMDRGRFDRWLAELAAFRVELRCGWRLRRVEPVAGEGFELRLSDGSRQVSERARLVVGADGAASRVRRDLFGPGWPGQRYIGIQEWVTGSGDRASFQAFFDPTITDFYGWAIPKGDHHLFGVALPTGAEARTHFAQFREALRRHGIGGDVVHREAGLIVRPSRPFQAQGAVGGVALIGEAGGWISPSSAEGFSYAMRSALALATALEPGPDGYAERYNQAMRPVRVVLWLKRCKGTLVFRPYLRRWILQTGIRSLRRASAEGCSPVMS